MGQTPLTVPRGVWLCVEGPALRQGRCGGCRLPGPPQEGMQALRHLPLDAQGENVHGSFEFGVEGHIKPTLIFSYFLPKASQITFPVVCFFQFGKPGSFPCNLNLMVDALTKSCHRYQL